MKQRIFTFGCSFTRYFWPTWSDILQKEYSKTYDTQNWGQIGACNYYIFNSIIEANIKNKINKDDIVIVMWTSVARESRYFDKAWITPGSVYNNDVYSDDYVKKFADTRGYLIRDCSMIYAIDNLLTSIGCKFYFLSMIDIENTNEFEVKVSAQNRDILKNYSPTINKIRPSVHKIIFNNNWYFLPNISKHNPNLTDCQRNIFAKELNNVRIDYEAHSGNDWPSFDDFYNNNYANTVDKIKNEIAFLEEKLNWNKVKSEMFRFDFHAYPMEHLSYIDQVLPEFKISNETKDWITNIHNKLINCDFFDQQRWINKDKVKRW